MVSHEGNEVNAHLVKGVVKRQEGAEAQLFPGPAEVRGLALAEPAEGRRHDAVVLVESLGNLAGSDVELGQTPPVVLHLFNEVRRRPAVGEQPGGGAGSDGGQGLALPGIVPQPAQVGQEPTLEEFRLGSHPAPEVVQVDSQLLAQDFGGDRQSRGCARGMH